MAFTEAVCPESTEPEVALSTTVVPDRTWNWRVSDSASVSVATAESFGVETLVYTVPANVLSEESATWEGVLGADVAAAAVSAVSATMLVLASAVATATAVVRSRLPLNKEPAYERDSTALPPRR